VPALAAARAGSRRSGLYVEWRGSSILTAPFFSNHGLWRAGFGRIVWDDEAIRRGLEGLPLETIRAVLAGHSHYDHFSDLPPILLEHAVTAEVWVNRSGANMLAAYPELTDRLHVLDERLGEWIPVPDGDGNALPIRFMPLESTHADHFGPYHYARGEVRSPWTSWENKRLRHMKEGAIFAFLVDFLSDDGRVEHRLFLHDAAGPALLGFPPSGLLAERPVDLAATCMPSFWRAQDYPADLLRRTNARHVLVTHYEDFFRSREKPLRFVARLTDRRADRFMERVRSEMSHPRHETAGPQPCTCGPCGEAWSVPLPGEWLRFRAADGDRGGDSRSSGTGD
jgi:L-ascorbate metabolism protein UlaG (beta-lactamase superfamily)